MACSCFFLRRQGALTWRWNQVVNTSRAWAFAFLLLQPGR
jgi:hypothetical protein